MRLIDPMVKKHMGQDYFTILLLHSQKPQNLFLSNLLDTRLTDSDNICLNCVQNYCKKSNINVVFRTGTNALFNIPLMMSNILH